MAALSRLIDDRLFAVAAAHLVSAGADAPLRAHEVRQYVVIAAAASARFRPAIVVGALAAAAASS